MERMPISPVKVALNEIDNYGGHNPEIRGGEGLVLGRWVCKDDLCRLQANYLLTEVVWLIN